MESMNFTEALEIIPSEPNDLEVVRSSEDILINIYNLLDSFTVPNPDLITEARKYIQALRSEGAPKTKDESEPFKKTLLKKLYRKFKGCVGCGGGVMGGISRDTNILQPHHILPSEFGGKAIAQNAMLVCRNCHIQIHN